MKLSDYDYYLPRELIAQRPLAQRDQSRLMVLHRGDGGVEHREFKEIVGYLRCGDCLVVNETKVLPARLWGHKQSSGGRVEVFLTRRIEKDTWQALVRPGRRVPVGSVVLFGQGELKCEILERTVDGGRLIRFNKKADIDSELQRFGQVPLPPYIRRKPEPEDRLKYQTVYARVPGAVAAPTAGLHFTDSLLEIIKAKGVQVVPILLHVGVGTFRPVTAQNPEEHRIHPEYYQISEEAAKQINQVRRDGGRVFAVGTTTVRALESSVVTADRDYHILKSGSGWTEKFIYPPYQFKFVDALVTNFHLPRSTLLMLVSAFAGREFILRAYREAIHMRYRFLSFGDAMLIL
ncbi:MAG: tRNA preQ1(34) S-adenosylmethionine ribosyltransferase-isomerase QueA [Candidatus Latescibacteria bacterium]|nr:tRNA preQ1(34) S-adenosylmethionine ribosyltransferase-isomerase QueA [Candidatus Latescibacterota bacterium]